MKLSFIVPIYNVEQYLRKCVDSLLAQDYDDYEIILVDDGSTDGSGAICDSYVRLNELENEGVRELGKPLIRVIHQKNGGLSAARNAGLKEAKGEYICFVDSDDYWEPNVLARLMAQVERDKLDVLRFKYQNVRLKSERIRELENEREYEVFNPYKRDRRLENDYSEEPTDGVSFLNSRMNTQCYAVMFIIKRCLLIKNEGVNELMNEGCSFTPGIYFENTDWTPRMLRRANRVASTDTIVYNYFVRDGSISRAVDRTKQQKVLSDILRLIATLQQQSIDLKKSGRYNRWYEDMISDTVVSVYGLLSTHFYSERNEYLEQLKQMKVYPIAARGIKARLINISPQLAIWLLHIKNAHKHSKFITKR